MQKVLTKTATQLKEEEEQRQREMAREKRVSKFLPTVYF
jgi:hypothetical protein